MENKKLCSICRGQCCKHGGCELSPSDFKEGVTYETIKARIERGLISIDWWEGNVFEDIEDSPYRSENINRCLFLRMRHKGASVVDPSFGGECVALTEKGCSLPYDERPKGGRELIPDIEIKKDYLKLNCHSDWSKKDSAIEWFEYREILHRLLTEYFNPSDIPIIRGMADMLGINLTEYNNDDPFFNKFITHFLEM